MIRKFILLLVLVLFCAPLFAQPALPGEVPYNLRIRGWVIPWANGMYSLGNRYNHWRTGFVDSLYVVWINTHVSVGSADSLYHIYYTNYLQSGRTDSTSTLVPWANSSYDLGSVSLKYKRGYFDTLFGHHKGTAQNADSLFHRVYYLPLTNPDSGAVAPIYDLTYSMGGPSNRWKKGHIYNLWSHKIYGTGGPGTSVDSAFIDKLMGGRGHFVLGVNHADTSDSAGVAAVAHESRDADSLGGKHSGAYPDTSKTGWNKVGSTIKQTHLFLKDSTGVTVTVAGDTAKISTTALSSTARDTGTTIVLDSLYSKWVLVDTLATWIVPKHAWGNALANLTDTLLATGLIDDDCVAVGVGFIHGTGSTHNPIEWRFGVIDTFYVYRQVTTDPDSIGNFTIFKKK